MTVKLYLCPSTGQRVEVTSAVAKSPRPAMTFPVPVASTDYEAIMGVQPSAIDPARYNSGNRFAIMSRDSRVRITDVQDGTSNTVMVVECAAQPLVYRLRALQPTLSNDQGIGWADSEGTFSLDGAGPGAAIAVSRATRKPRSS